MSEKLAPGNTIPLPQSCTNIPACATFLPESTHWQRPIYSLMTLRASTLFVYSLQTHGHSFLFGNGKRGRKHNKHTVSVFLSMTVQC